MILKIFFNHISNSMPIKYKWNFLGKFKNEKEYLSLLDTFPPYATTNNNQVNCTICNEGKPHKMRQMYLLCTSKLCGKACKAKLKIENCLTKSIMKVYSLNEHEFIHDNVEIKEKKTRIIKANEKIN